MTTRKTNPQVADGTLPPVVRGPIGGAWDEFKIVDGVKLYRGDCKICGREFYHKNPYKVRCEDREGHAEIARHRKAQNEWKQVHHRGRVFSDNWSGSWDNCVRANEE